MNVEKRADDATVIRYLLGNASAAEQEQIEECFFTDDEFSELVVAFETELIDRYVQGELSATEIGQFETRFLTSPARRERLAFAQTLVRPDRNPPQPEATGNQVAPAAALSWQTWLNQLSGWLFGPQLAWAAAALLVILGGTFAWMTVQLQNQLQAVKTEQARTEQQNQVLEQQLAAEKKATRDLNTTLDQERTTRQQLEQQLANQPAASPASTLLSFFLVPGLVRDSTNVKPLVLPAETTAVRFSLQLNREDDYPSYHLSIATQAQAKIWNGSRLKTKPGKAGRVVIALVPAKVLKPGTYLLTLSGVTAEGMQEELDDYQLVVKPSPGR